MTVSAVQLSVVMRLERLVSLGHRSRLRRRHGDHPHPSLYHGTVTYKNPDVQRQYQLVWMWRRRLQWILENGPCRWCGSVNNLSVSFRNPATKTVKVASIWSRSEENRTEILANCEVLCQECHRKKIAIWRAVKAALDLRPGTA